MNGPFLVLLMIFCHIAADYNLQGWLANAKQKSWWEANAPDEMYIDDYLCALLVHSFAWAFMVMLPIAYYMHFNVDGMFIGMLFANIIGHFFIDHMKANVKVINLWIDQALHMVQLAITLYICVMLR